MTYILLTVYLVLVSLLYSHGLFKKKHYLFLSFAPLAYFMGFRSMDMPICVDTYNYSMLFDYVASESWGHLFSISSYSGAESGYLILNKLFSTLSPDYYFFQVCTSIIFCFAIAFFIYKQVDNPVLALSLFLGLNIYLSAYNISRQLLMVSLFSLLIPFLKGKKWFLTIPVLFLLSTIHTTALLYLIVPLLYFIPERYNRFIPFMLLIGLICFDSLVDMSSSYFLKYDNYYQNETGHKYGVGLSSVVYILIVVINVLTLFWGKNITKDDRINVSLSLFAVMCIFLGLKLNYMERIGFLFFPYTILSLDKIREMLNNKSVTSVICVGLEVVMFMFFYLRMPKEFIHF